jgi:hypothetical protein
VFEVIEIGPITETKRWFRSSSRIRPAKLKVVSTTFVEKLDRTFEGHSRYSTQTYRADFTEGEVITIWFSESKMLAIGDLMSAETLAGQGYLSDYFRLFGTKG